MVKTEAKAIGSIPAKSSLPKSNLLAPTTPQSSVPTTPQKKTSVLPKAPTTPSTPTINMPNIDNAAEGSSSATPSVLSPKTPVCNPELYRGSTDLIPMFRRVQPQKKARNGSSVERCQMVPDQSVISIASCQLDLYLFSSHQSPRHLVQMNFFVSTCADDVAKHRTCSTFVYVSCDFKPWSWSLSRKKQEITQKVENSTTWQLQV